MEDKRCLVFVGGKECGLPLSQIDREAEKIARYDVATYQCGLGQRSYFLQARRVTFSRMAMASRLIKAVCPWVSVCIASAQG